MPDAQIDRRCGTRRWWGEPVADWWALVAWTPKEPVPSWMRGEVTRGNYHTDCPTWQAKDADASENPDYRT